MALQDAMARFRSIYRTLDGARFYGQIFAPPVLDNPNRMEQPRLFLKVGMTCAIGVGAVIVAQSKNYLVCENAQSDREVPQYRTYKLIRLDQYLPLTRQEIATDAATGFARSYDISDPIGSIWCAVEVDRTIRDTLGVTAEQYKLFTNAVLKIKDTVGRYTVTLVDTQLGITVATVK